MRLYLDLATLSLIAGPNDRRVISQIQAKRGDALPMEIQFLRNGQPERLPASTVVTFCAKPLNQFDASPVVLDDLFVQSAAPGGSAFDDAKWTSAPSLNTTALNSLFFIDGDSSNDPQFVDLSAEITWQADGDIGPTTIRTFVFRVLNDVFRGDEGTPTSIPGPGEWLSARAVRYDQDQDLTAAQRWQARENIGSSTEELYFGANITAPPAGFEREFATLAGGGAYEMVLEVLDYVSPNRAGAELLSLTIAGGFEGTNTNDGFASATYEDESAVLMLSLTDPATAQPIQKITINFETSLTGALLFQAGGLADGASLKVRISLIKEPDDTE